MEIIKNAIIGNITVELANFNSSYYIFVKVNNSKYSKCLYEGHTFAKASNEYKKIVLSHL